jgi:hypothetical protein
MTVKEALFAPVAVCGHEPFLAVTDHLDGMAPCDVGRLAGNRKS